MLNSAHREKTDDIKISKLAHICLLKAFLFTNNKLYHKIFHNSQYDAYIGKANSEYLIAEDYKTLCTYPHLEHRDSRRYRRRPTHARVFPGFP